MWLTFLKALVEFLPYILKWLEPLFNRIEGKLGAFPEDAVLAVNDACDAARGELSWWQFAKIRQLAKFRRVALGRAKELAERAAGAREPVLMTTAEYESVARA
jgi:hypothetical protein